jgi:hypothetical protein
VKGIFESDGANQTVAIFQSFRKRTPVVTNYGGIFRAEPLTNDSLQASCQAVTSLRSSGTLGIVGIVGGHCEVRPPLHLQVSRRDYGTAELGPDPYGNTGIRFSAFLSSKFANWLEPLKPTIAVENMSEASARSSNVSEEAQQRVPDGEADRGPVALPPTRPDGLVVLWHDDAGDVGNVLSDYEQVLQ